MFKAENLLNNKIMRSKKFINRPIISVILSIDNDCTEELLKRVIESILNQTFKFFELIIISDPIPDELDFYIKNYIDSDNRVIYIKNLEELKSDALKVNQGLINANGKYITYQSQNGYWYKESLENLHREISAKADECLVYSKIKVINNSKHETIEIGQTFKYYELLDRNFIIRSSVIHSKNIIETLGGYDSSSELQEFYEWDAWIRWSSKIQFIFMDKISGIEENDNLQVLTRDIDIFKLNMFRSIQFTERTKTLKNVILNRSNKYEENKRQVNILVVKVFFDPTLDVTFTNFVKISHNKYNMIYISSHQLNEEILEMVDVVVLHRTYDTCSAEFLKLVKSKKKPVIYWLDDDLLEVHQFIEGFLTPNTTQFDELIYQLKNSDLIVSANSQISNSVRKYNNNVKELKITILKQYINRNYSMNNDVFKIAYMGNPRKDELNFIWEDILSISSKYKKKVEFYFWGYTPELIEEIKYSEVHTKQYTMSYYQYLEDLNRESFDLIIAPLFESKFNSGKSATKYLEACVCRAVGLYSEVSTYSTIIDGVTGFKVKNQKGQWKDRIEEIINMEPLHRQKIYNNAVRDIINNHSTESQINNFEEIILNLKPNYLKNHISNLSQEYIDIPMFNVDKFYNILKDVIEKFNLQERILFEKYLLEIKFNLEKLMDYKKFSEDKMSYIIWGASESGKIIKMIIDKILPNFTLIGFIDKFKKGIFDGIEIYSTDQLEILNFDYVFIATSRGRSEAELTLMKMNLKKYEDFSSFF